MPKKKRSIVTIKISGSIFRWNESQFLSDDRGLLIILDDKDISSSVIGYRISSEQNSTVMVMLVFPEGFELEGYNLLEEPNETLSLTLPVKFEKEGKEVSHIEARKFIYDNIETYKRRVNG